MKIWQETSDILDRLQTVAERGGKVAVAVLVHIEGSAYRRPGAKLFVDENGSALGSVSGGCLEEDVRQVGLEVMRTGEPRHLHYDTGADDETVWGLGLGCEGSVDLFVQHATATQYLETARAARRLLDGTEKFAVVTVLDGLDATDQRIVVTAEGSATGTTGYAARDEALTSAAIEAIGQGNSCRHRVGDLEVFIEVQLPPPFLLICGAGDDAMPLALFGEHAGFRVIVVDHRPAYLEADRFASAWKRTRVSDPASGDGVRQEMNELPLAGDTFAVVKTHSLARDTAWVENLLGTEVPYIGLLGPRDRRDEILRSVAESDRARLFGPVGLDLGAEGPEQVAVSIVAELLAVRAGRTPTHLRHSEEPIHAR